MRSLGTGTVIAVNRSSGGIPKMPLERAAVTSGGILGDGHNHEKHRTPTQALCLLRGELLDELHEEGYDLSPGALGENITLRGLDLREITVGDELHFSRGVRAECTKLRSPCYVLDEICPKLKTLLRGRIGIYARVIAEGELSPGETVAAYRPHSAARAT